MREKIILRDFTVLLVCTNIKWSTVERRVLSDSTFLRNMGCNPVILCQKGSQIDLAAEVEDLPRVYINKRKINLYVGLQFLFEMRDLIKQTRFDIIHCYSLSATWFSAFILKSHHQTPLFFTLNQNLKPFYHNLIAKWLLKRVDIVFTLSDEVREFAEEAFPVNSKKIRNLGSGLDSIKRKYEKKEIKNLGCVINNINELKRLKYIIKVFRVLKSHSELAFDHLQLHIFLGPRIYQKDNAKKILTELDYEFYEGDILLYSLDTKFDLLKELDVFIGLAFDEPLNDYELISMMNGVPVLFPRTAVRQNLLFRYSWVGESYYDGDIREARTKLAKIITNFQIYRSALAEFSDEIIEDHGLDKYAEVFQRSYEKSYEKRQRLRSQKS